MGRLRTVDDNRILEVARQAFLARGHLASTREIADGVGISQAVLFQRFGSKEKLFFAAMAPPSPDVEHILGSTPDDRSETELYLVDVCERLYEYFESVAPLFVQLATHESFDTEHLASAHQPIVDSGIHEAFRERIDELLATGFISGGNGAAITQLLVSVVHGEALASAIMKVPPDVRRRREMFRTVWRGLSPEGS